MYTKDSYKNKTSQDIHFLCNKSNIMYISQFLKTSFLIEFSIICFMSMDLLASRGASDFHA